MVAKSSSARPTIRDVAKRAGVSISSASYALNNQYGASAATRERVLAAAAELGWQADSSARRLASSRSETIGLVLPVSTTETFGDAPWFMEFIAGVESVLAGGGYALLLQAVRDRDEELHLYNTWSRSRRVDGVVLVDISVADPRLAAVAALGVPAVVAGPPSYAGALACVWTDDGAAVHEAIRYLARLGHTVVGRVSGPADLAHTAVRGQAFDDAVATAGVRLQTVVGDFSGQAASRAVRALLTTDPRPSVLVFDDDVAAVVGLGVAHELGVSVPGELNLLAWDDSVLCRSTYPQLSAMSHDVVGYGAEVAARLLDLIAGAAPDVHLVEPAHLVTRGTTGPAPGPLHR